MQEGCQGEDLAKAMQELEKKVLGDKCKPEFRLRKIRFKSLDRLPI